MDELVEAVKAAIALLESAEPGYCTREWEALRRLQFALKRAKEYDKTTK
jgi:hypothetical protein